MEAEMPKKYWSNLPEAALIPSLLKEAPRRVETMVRKSISKRAVGNEEEWHPAEVPVTNDLAKVEAAAKTCTACHLYKRGTQTVFGEGPKRAKLLFLGEQPGDQEDLSGKPFVGPSGKLLDRALEEAGIDRDDVYVTNAVKHFKWERDEKGKRRIHKTPNATEVRACFPWLEQEIEQVQPRVIVALGATAAKALLGREFSVMKHRGRAMHSTWA